MGVQGEGHVISGGAAGGDFGRDGPVQCLRTGKAQCSVHKVLLIVHYEKQPLHRVHHLSVKTPVL